VKGAITPPAITLLLPETIKYFQTWPEYSSLSVFTKEAGKQLLIYDRKLTDPADRSTLVDSPHTGVEDAHCFAI
jgi:hypothetical protein